MLQNQYQKMFKPSKHDIENPQGSVVRNVELNASFTENLVQANISHENSAWDDIFIYRIPQCLREAAGDDKVYSPQIVSLGPYHHGQKRLEPMEHHKCRALAQILKRNGLESPDPYREAVRELEQRARDCYEGPICDCKNLTTQGHTNKCSEDFVTMMLVDSCFILELFWGTNTIMGNTVGFTALGYSKHDPIFGMRATMHMIQRDMIMLENQIPLFILDKLFTLLKEGNQYQMGACNLNQLALIFFDPLMPTWNGGINSECRTYDPSKAENGFNSGISTIIDIEGDSRAIPRTQLHLLEVFRRNLLRIPMGREEAKPVADKRRQHVIPCVKKLREQGIRFESLETGKFWDIKFENGKLKIPQLIIHNGTKSLFLNLIAYEQCHLDSENEITSYLLFMDNLIDNPDDVTHLYSRGIIEHCLGSDEKVAELFNQMCQEVVFDRKRSYLSTVSQEVNDYRSQRRNGWKASLNHKYFNNPWSIISFIAAVVLLLLTGLQTFYTVYPYYRPG